MQCDQNTKEIYTNSFRWEREKGEKLIARFIMEDFEAFKEVKNRRKNYFVFVFVFFRRLISLILVPRESSGL